VAAPIDPDTPRGESHGIVWKVEPSTAVVRVSPSWSGIGAVPFALTDETRIVVGDKEGGFGDVYAGRPIKIVYERREDTMIALCVELYSGRDRGADRCRSGAPPGDLASAAPTAPAAPAQ
jgi:hypothetical protein